MKQKDLVYLLLAVVILLVAGYVVYTNLLPSSTTDTGVKVDIVGSIAGDLDREGRDALNDPLKSKDFSSPVEFTGLNNATPFGK